MKTELYFQNNKIATIEEEDDLDKALNDYALIYNCKTSDFKQKSIPENIVDEDILQGHCYPGHEMWLD